MPSPIINATNIIKNYSGFRALNGVSLTVEDGEFMALVGPSGCGKTSLLKILAGFEDLTDGQLTIQGKDMRGVPAAARPTRMVFQKLALFPHMTVRENIAFPLQTAKVDPAVIAVRVQEMMALMHLKPEYLSRFPAQLSGGEQQRVALARALISKPSVLLLDEPMSALDAKLKKSLQAELKKLHRELGTSFVLVTHDLEEAMMLADRICVMVAGQIVQIGAPMDIYRSPANSFVAGFIGETNMLPVKVSRSAAGFVIAPAMANGEAVTLPQDRVSREAIGDTGLLLVRPEDGVFVEGPVPSDMWTLRGVVDEKFTKGASTQYRINVPELTKNFVLEASGYDASHITLGREVTIGLFPSKCYLLKDAP